METWAQMLIALTIIMEARGQPDLGKAMVAEVVMSFDTPLRGYSG